MTQSINLISKDDALKLIKNAKQKNNRPLDEFYQITEGNKNTIRNLPYQSQKFCGETIGTSKVRILWWKE